MLHVYGHDIGYGDITDKRLATMLGYVIVLWGSKSVNYY